MNNEQALELMRMTNAKAVVLPGFDGVGRNVFIQREGADKKIVITETPLTQEQIVFIREHQND